jgi:putative ABC transport system ATP-binding protein
MPTTAIDLQALRFRWPGQADVCLEITGMTLDSAEQIFLHGASGSGKTTLLNLLGGVLVPDSGQVRVLGHDLAALSGAARDRFRVDHVGFIFQQFNLIPYLSVLDNVLLPTRFSPRRRARALENAASPEAEAGRLLNHLDLDPGLWRRAAADLSVGQQQRVAAARALIGRPELVIADEPTSALDAERQDAFLDLLGAECSAAGASLVFVSHDQRLARHFHRTLAMAELNRAGRAA